MENLDERRRGKIGLHARRSRRKTVRFEFAERGLGDGKHVFPHSLLRAVKQGSRGLGAGSALRYQSENQAQGMFRKGSLAFLEADGNGRRRNQIRSVIGAPIFIKRPAPAFLSELKAQRAVFLISTARGVHPNAPMP